MFLDLGNELNLSFFSQEKNINTVNNVMNLWLRVLKVLLFESKHKLTNVNPMGDF